jgi:hypothetical protein
LAKFPDFNLRADLISLPVKPLLFRTLPGKLQLACQKASNNIGKVVSDLLRGLWVTNRVGQALNDPVADRIIYVLLGCPFTEDHDLVVVVAAAFVWFLGHCLDFLVGKLFAGTVLVFEALYGRFPSCLVGLVP